MNFFHLSFNILSLIKTIGLYGIFTVAFLESGIFLGCFLPGDSMLFAAGVLAAAGYFNVSILFLGSFVAGILGNCAGYYFGQKVGPKIFSRDYNSRSIFLNKRNIDKTSLFFKKHGDKTIILARFIPVVRTFAPIMAGVGEMDYRVFFFWDVLGALVWAGTMVFAGYFLGNSISNIDAVILPVILVIILISLLPVFWNFFHKKV